MASPLVGLAFAALDDQTLFDEGVEMLVELVHFSKEADSHAQLVAGTALALSLSLSLSLSLEVD